MRHYLQLKFEYYKMASQIHKQRKLVIIAGIFALVGFILLIVGIVLLTKSKSKDCDLDEADNDKEKHRQTDHRRPKLIT